MPPFVPEEWSREIRGWLLGRPECIDRLPFPAGRESVFELLCVVRLLDALHGPSGQIRLPSATGVDFVPHPLDDTQ